MKTGIFSPLQGLMYPAHQVLCYSFFKWKKKQNLKTNFDYWKYRHSQKGHYERKENISWNITSTQKNNRENALRQLAQQ